MLNLTIGLLIFAILLIVLIPGGGTVGLGLLVAAGVVEYSYGKNYDGLFFADCC